MGSRKNKGLFLVAAFAGLLYLPSCGGASPATRGDDPGSEPMEQERALARVEKVELGMGPTAVTLGGPGIASRIDALGARRLYLILRGLRASQPPGVLYHLYLNLPPGATPAGEDPRHAGIINFYAAQTGDAATADSNRMFYSFDVTEVARALRARGQLGGPITVTFYPVGSPDPGAKAVISRIELVEQ